MKKVPAGSVIKVVLETGYAGMDDTSYYKLSQDYTEKELDDTCWDMALENAAMYGIYPNEDAPDDVDPYDSDDYSDSIDGHWTIVEDSSDVYDDIDTETF